MTHSQTNILLLLLLLLLSAAPAPKRSKKKQAAPSQDSDDEEKEEEEEEETDLEEIDQKVDQNVEVDQDEEGYCTKECESLDEKDDVEVLLSSCAISPNFPSQGSQLLMEMDFNFAEPPFADLFTTALTENFSSDYLMPTDSF